MKKMEIKSSILLSIVKKENLWKLIDSLKEDLQPEQFLVLKSTNNHQYQDFFFVICQSTIGRNEPVKHRFTVVHKKGRCYYTINALNALVALENDGVPDENYIIDWQKYQNMIFFMNKDKQLVQLKTRLYKMINNN